jgi:hypothetical protein
MGCFVAGLGTQAPGFAALVWPCAACRPHPDPGVNMVQRGRLLQGIVCENR